MTEPPAHDQPPQPATRPEIREQMRQQMLTGFGGWTGMAISAAPTVVFVAVNALTSLRPAVLAAVGCALLLMAYRLIRRQSVQQAANGLVGVVLAAAIAARTGQARGYFILGIWSSFLYGGVFLVSMLVRRPLVGVIWEFLDPTPQVDLSDAARAVPGAPPGAGEGMASLPWYRRPILARAYLLATAGATLVFGLRAVVQLSLFRENHTGWLAVARIAMGYPLTIALLGFAWLVVRRARARLIPADSAR